MLTTHVSLYSACLVFVSGLTGRFFLLVARSGASTVCTYPPCACTANSSRMEGMCTSIGGDVYYQLRWPKCRTCVFWSHRTFAIYRLLLKTSLAIFRWWACRSPMLQSIACTLLFREDAGELAYQRLPTDRLRSTIVVKCWGFCERNTVRSIHISSLWPLSD